MSRFISRAEFAKLAGCTVPNVAVLQRARLAPASDGPLVDVDHPAAVAYLEKRKVRLREPPRPGRPRERPDLPVGETSLAIDAYLDMTLRELTDRHGDVKELRGYFDARKKIEDIRYARLRNDEQEGALISRDLVRTHVFGLLDAVNRRLLSDSPRTIVQRIYALAQAGVPLEQAEQEVRSLIGAQLRGARDSVVAALDRVRRALDGGADGD